MNTRGKVLLKFVEDNGVRAPLLGDLCELSGSKKAMKMNRT